MTPLLENNSYYSSNDDYDKAEQMINRAIADMKDENHIEYGSTMERKAPPPKWKRWLHKMLRPRS